MYVIFSDCEKVVCPKLKYHTKIAFEVMSRASMIDDRIFPILSWKNGRISLPACHWICEICIFVFSVVPESSRQNNIVPLTFHTEESMGDPSDFNMAQEHFRIESVLTAPSGGFFQPRLCLEVIFLN